MSLLALVVYEYFLTLQSEIALFWMPRGINGASILFILNRYITLVAQVLSVTPLPTSFHVSYVAAVLLRNILDRSIEV